MEKLAKDRLLSLTPEERAAYEAADPGCTMRCWWELFDDLPPDGQRRVYRVLQEDAKRRAEGKELLPLC